ncbi:MAG: hypothetical protein PWP65_1552 [Clostridia bacterium]|nr:hypothetical protein [Clostridia bacterium]
MACPANRSFCELIGALATVLDIEEGRKLYHAWRVAVVAEKLAQMLVPEERTAIFYAGLLHDLGAMGLDDHLVHRALIPGHENDREVREHPDKGSKLVALLPGVGAAAAPLIRDHHEYWDGSGYPQGKKGPEIPLGAQIITISDFFDLYLRHLPGNSWDKIAQKMQKEVNKKYSADLSQALSEVMAHGLFEQVADDAELEKAMDETMGTVPAPEFNEKDPMSKTIRLFAQIIDAKHAYTGGHSQRVAAFAVSLGKELGLEPAELQRLEAAALLHDFGKIAVPRAILDKPGPLNDVEMARVREHPGYTQMLLQKITSLKDLAPIAALHHERYDGRGYPKGLKNGQIPLGARIIAVADALDAMTSARPYQPRRTLVEAYRVLQKEAGKQFDPEVVDAARTLLA